MAGLAAAAVARFLVEFGRRMELAGENPYRVPKERVLNCLELPAFSKFLQERRRASTSSQKSRPRRKVCAAKASKA